MPTDYDWAVASYAPGASVALASDGLWLLADVKPDDPILNDLWECLRRGSIEGASLSRPSWLLTGHSGVARDPTERRGLSGHRDGWCGRAEAVRGDRRHTFSCPPGVAQTEYRLPDLPDLVRLALDDGPSLARVPPLSWCGSGRLPPVGVGCRFDADQRGGGIRPPPRGNARPKDDTAAQSVMSQESSNELSTSFGFVSNETVAPLSISADTITASMVEPGVGVDVRGGAEEGIGNGLNEGTLSSVDEGPEAGYDYLFGHTVHRSVTDTAVHADGASAPEESDRTLEVSQARLKGEAQEVLPNVPARSAAKSDPPTAPVRAPIAAERRE